MDVEPGVPNIVPGTVRAIIEIRAGDAKTLDILEDRLRALVADLHPAALATDMAQLTVRPVVSVMPTPTDETLVKRLADTLNTSAVAWESLPSSRKTTHQTSGSSELKLSPETNQVKCDS